MVEALHHVLVRPRKRQLSIFAEHVHALLVRPRELTGLNAQATRALLLETREVLAVDGLLLLDTEHDTPLDINERFYPKERQKREKSG